MAAADAARRSTECNQARGAWHRGPSASWMYSRHGSSTGWLVPVRLCRLHERRDRRRAVRGEVDCSLDQAHVRAS